MQLATSAYLQFPWENSGHWPTRLRWFGSFQIQAPCFEGYPCWVGVKENHRESRRFCGSPILTHAREIATGHAVWEPGSHPFRMNLAVCLGQHKETSPITSPQVSEKPIPSTRHLGLTHCPRFSFKLLVQTSCWSKLKSVYFKRSPENPKRASLNAFRSSWSCSKGEMNFLCYVFVGTGLSPTCEVKAVGKSYRKGSMSISAGISGNVGLRRRWADVPPRLPCLRLWPTSLEVG